MKNDSGNQQNETQAESSPNAEFMEKFQRAIESYAEAVNADKAEEADQAALMALMLAGAEAEAHPTPELSLEEGAAGFLRSGEWARAEDAYRKLLARQEQSGNFGLIAKPQMELCKLFQLIGRWEDAWSFARAATASARRTQMFTLVAMTLENEALCALARGDTARALNAASEAVQVIEPGKMFDLMRAQAFSIRAQCLLAAGNAEEAEKDLQSGWEILGKRKLSGIGTGPVVALAKWWEVQADVHVRNGALVNAGSALEKAIEYRREGLNRSCDPSLYAFAALARSLKRLAELASKTGDSGSAEKALAEAQAIWEKVRLPMDF